MFPLTVAWTQRELQSSSRQCVSSLPWSCDLGINVNDLDAEHKVLLDCLNAILRAIPLHKGASRMALEFNALSAEAHAHCAREESTMEKTHFSGLEEHHEFHSELLRRLASLRYSLTNAPSYFGSNAAFNNLSQWFVPHLQSGDLQFSAFMQQAFPGERLLDRRMPRDRRSSSCDQRKVHAHIVDRRLQPLDH